MSAHEIELRRIEAELRHRPLDTARWIDLARVAERLGRLPGFLDPEVHLVQLQAAWGDQPASRELATLVLPLMGLALPATREPAPPRWWRRCERHGERAGHWYDLETGYPLEVVRAADGARLRLVAGDWNSIEPVFPFYVEERATHVEAYRAAVEAEVVPPPEDWETQLGNPGNPAVWMEPRDARAYAAWRGARLPTMAEWRHAVHAGSADPYPWGTAPPDPSRCNWRPVDRGFRHDWEPEELWAARWHTFLDGVEGTEEGASPFGLRQGWGNVRELVEVGEFEADPAGVAGTSWIQHVGVPWRVTLFPVDRDVGLRLVQPLYP